MRPDIRLTVVALLLAACSSSPEAAPTPSPTVSVTPPPRVSAKALSRCRQAAREGLHSYQVAVDVSEGTAVKADFDTQYEDTYQPADEACSKQLKKYASSETLVSCKFAGYNAAAAAFQLRDELKASSKSASSAARQERLSDLRQAAGEWDTCFPNQKIPEEFRV